MEGTFIFLSCLCCWRTPRKDLIKVGSDDTASPSFVTRGVSCWSCVFLVTFLSDFDRFRRLFDLVAVQLEGENARDQRWFASLNNGCGAEMSETFRTPSAGSGKHNLSESVSRGVAPTLDPADVRLMWTLKNVTSAWWANFSSAGLDKWGKNCMARDFNNVSSARFSGLGGAKCGS